jgi:hypothetical protein
VNHISGGSDAPENDRVRRLLHDLCSGDGRAKSYVGYSRGSVCQACGSAINRATSKYEVVTITANYDSTRGVMPCLWKSRARHPELPRPKFVRLTRARSG